ncbi:MAG: DUF2130 domain-containing protein [Planctomycetales bacterium]|nr:DUF2130 domain-containing protein [Planctomycetales bacterium]
MPSTIACPTCHSQIAIDEVLTTQLTAQLKADMEREIASKNAELEKARKQLSDDRLEVAKTREELSARVQAEVEKQRAAILTEAKQAAEQKLTLEIHDQKSQLEELANKLKEAQTNEIELRRRERKLESEKQELQLAVEREVDAQRANIREQAYKQFAEEHRMKDAEQQKVVSDLKRQIDELKRKAEQGSQQTQGEVQEIALEELLEATFRSDSIEAIAKGVNGGDTLHRVICGSGTVCGSILWESKRTKHFSKDWLPKLRNDQREARASCSVIVTQTMPEGIEHFGLLDGVWVCNWACVRGLATALRLGIIEAHKNRLASEGRAEKMELVYNYLSGREFQRCVEGIVDAFVGMQTELEKEKRSMQAIWKRREKQIDQAIGCTAGLYGDLQGIFGHTLPKVENLCLPEPSFDKPAAIEAPAVSDTVVNA